VATPTPFGFGEGLWKPNNIVAIDNMVFVWSEDGRILYRVNTDKRMVEALDLRGIGFGDVYVRRSFVRSLAIKDENTFCFGFGPDVVEVSMKKARWRKVDVGLAA
jgi:hypothetical protein